MMMKSVKDTWQSILIQRMLIQLTLHINLGNAEMKVTPCSTIKY